MSTKQYKNVRKYWNPENSQSLGEYAKNDLPEDNLENSGSKSFKNRKNNKK